MTAYPLPHPIERTDILSWGRVARQPQYVVAPRFEDEMLAAMQLSATSSLLPTGLRRSYGDSCLNSSGVIVDMAGADHFIAIDAAAGVLRAQAGVSLSQVLQLTVPKGWFLPTTPGTRFVTLGGAIANDVHGKNHHRAGTMGSNVTALGLLRSTGERLTIGPGSSPELFAATVGGLGLTGIIEWVEIRLVRIDSAYLDVEIIPYDNLDTFWSLAEASVESHEHTVAWIDCMAQGGKLGRGVFSRANWAADREFTVHDDQTWKSLPIDMPGLMLNRLSVSAFNEVYYAAHKLKKKQARQHYATYFYPLDSILNWNRLYGWPGMLQYQCAIPPGAERDAIPVLLAEIAKSGQASFLAVLKTFGTPRSPGLLSFPRAGATLALDFPNHGAETLALMRRLDTVVAAAGGALYPAKDGRMTAKMFKSSYPDWEKFVALKDPAMNSDFWRRVMQ